MTQTISRLVERLNASNVARFFFAASRPESLALCRILFYGGLLAVLARWDTGFWATVPREMFFPVTFFAKFRVPIFNPESLRILGVFWKLSLLTSCLGYRTHLSTAVAFVLSLYFLGIPQNYGRVHLQDTLIVLAMLTLAASRCGDALSIDSRLSGRQRPAPSMEYTWPASLIGASMAWCFFAAGIAKVRHVGLAWSDAENISNTIKLMQYTGEGADSFSKIGLTLVEYPRLCGLLGVATLAIELAAIFALFSRYARIVIVPGLFCMQIGLWSVLGVDFTRFLLLYVFWVPWQFAFFRSATPNSEWDAAADQAVVDAPHFAVVAANRRQPQ